MLDVWQFKFKDVIKPNLFFFLYKLKRRFQKSTSRLLKMDGTPTSGHFQVISLVQFVNNSTEDVLHFKSEKY